MSDWEDRAYEIASFRYRLIADAAEADGEGVAEAIKNAALRETIDQTGKACRYSERTLWRYVAAYRQGGLWALKPKQRKDTGTLRAFANETLATAIQLRRENKNRPTKTIIDILERLKKVAPHDIKKSTLDRHLQAHGVSRRSLHSLGEKVFRKILTNAPLELVIADFHHGPYVRVPGEDKARRALLLAFIDHFSRYVIDSLYYLAEDFAVLRYGFRRVLLITGPFDKLYIDNGPSFQSGRFHAACKNEAINITVVHSKPYVSEGRGACERFNRTVKEQFESEVKARDELLFIDELNAYYEAWLAERYHHDIHSETGESPFERFHQNVTMREPPDLERIDELLRLRKKGTVHKKWSTVEVRGTRYLVDAALRGRRIHALYDPFAPDYVLIESNRQIVQRAYPQKPGEMPPQPVEEKKSPKIVDYLALLRQDYETRTRAELAAIRLRPPVKQELTQAVLEERLASCRGASLSDAEKSAVAAAFRKLRPIVPASAEEAIEGMRRRLGPGLHISIYIDVLQTSLVRARTTGGTEK